MLFDAHLHLGELLPDERLLPGAAVSSVHSPDDPLVKIKEPGVLLSYGIHPLWLDGEGRSLEILESFAADGTIAAVGECGFDFYAGRDEAQVKRQREIFLVQCAVAERHRLPLIVHGRRGMAELFAETRQLKRLPAVIFHCYSGTAEEGLAFLTRGINAYFSFGTPLVKGYRGAIAAFRALPQDRLLLETDAPFQPVHGRKRTFPADLVAIYEKGAEMLGVSREKLEERLWLTARTIFPALGKII